MEALTIKFNDPNLFDEIVHNAPPEGCDLQIVTKDDATRDGKPAAVISFTVKIQGTVIQVQTVTTVLMLQSLGQALIAKYPNL